MNILLSSYLKHFGKLKVVHRLLGRIRINIPGAAANINELRPYIPVMHAFIMEIDGVESAEFCEKTGNILIKYSPNVLKEASLLAYLDALWSRCVEILSKMKCDDLSDTRKVLSLLEKHLSKIKI